MRDEYRERKENLWKVITIKSLVNNLINPVEELQNVSLKMWIEKANTLRCLNFFTYYSWSYCKWNE